MEGDIRTERGSGLPEEGSFSDQEKGREVDGPDKMTPRKPHLEAEDEVVSEKNREGEEDQSKEELKELKFDELIKYPAIREYLADLGFINDEGLDDDDEDRAYLVEILNDARGGSSKQVWDVLDNFYHSRSQLEKDKEKYTGAIQVDLGENALGKLFKENGMPGNNIDKIVELFEEFDVVVYGTNNGEKDAFFAEITCQECGCKRLQKSANGNPKKRQFIEEIYGLLEKSKDGVKLNNCVYCNLAGR